MSKNKLQVISQAPSAVVMVRPHQFQVNPQTAGDNTFQVNHSDLTVEQIQNRAYQEVTNAAELLKSHGILVHLFDDKSYETPDSVFPNNWFSTHADGTLVLYPMYSPNRRLERREDIIRFLKENYQIKKIVDYSHYENTQQFLEGTGSMVLEHQQRIAYAVESQRMHSSLLNEFCQQLDFQPQEFQAYDKSGIAVYHTNVILSIGSQFALLGTDFIESSQKQKLVASIEETGKEVIFLSYEQVENFAANALEVKGRDGNYLALSRTAFNALTEQQKTTITQYVKLLPLEVPTIEMAGGSVRCMLAGVHFSTIKN